VVACVIGANHTSLVQIQALTRAQVRELDRLAIEELGIPSIVLMENAGRGAAQELLAFAARERSIAASRALIVCGRGNNGGDGYVVARHLHCAGCAVAIASAAARASSTGDALVMRSIVERMQIPIHERIAPSRLAELGEFDVVVDALLGTGFRGELEGELLEWVRAINALAKPFKVALDLPSGLDCDEGRACPEAVRADLTATFAAPKIGFERAEARRWLGRVVVCSIGAPPELAARVAR
jgi:NAD(P)H-hydrate epimerase